MRPSIRTPGWGTSLWLACLMGLTACEKPAPSDTSRTPPSPTALSTTMEPATTPATTTAPAPPQRLLVSRRRAGQLGTITFDATSRATLQTEGTGPDVEELKQAWAEISAKESLDWVKSRPEKRSETETVMIIEKLEVRPGDPRYVYAVFDTLSRKYGFSVDFEKP